jgi:nucleoside-diphosphate-sugar epimerase
MIQSSFKSALITGGAGFIGSNLVKLLLKLNWKLTVIDDLSSGNIKNLPLSDITFIKSNLIKINEIVFNEKFDCVFHLAASVGRQRSIDNPRYDSESNLIATIELLNFIKKNNIRKIVYSSSAAIYGELQNEVVHESHPLNPDSPYGVSKLAAEKMIFAYSTLYNFKAVALRYFNIYGINQRFDFYGNVIPIFSHLIREGKPINIYGDGNQTRDFLNVVDVVHANYISAINDSIEGFYNLGSGESISINQLVKFLSNIFNKEIKVNFLPKRIGDVYHCLADISKIIKVTDFKPSVKLYDGLQEYVKWFLGSNSN